MTFVRARTFLSNAGLLHSPKRGFFQISDHGARELSGDPESISTSILNKFDEFRGV
jgi:restriction system protein